MFNVAENANRADNCQAVTLEYTSDNQKYFNTISIICGDRKLDLSEVNYLKNDHYDRLNLASRALAGFCINCPNRLQSDSTKNAV